MKYKLMLLLSLILTGCGNSNSNSLTVTDSFDIEPFFDCNEEIIIEFEEYAPYNYMDFKSYYYCDKGLFLSSDSGIASHKSISNHFDLFDEIIMKYNFKTKTISVTADYDLVTRLSDDPKLIKKILINSGKSLLTQSKDSIEETKKTEFEHEMAKQRIKDAFENEK